MLKRSDFVINFYKYGDDVNCYVGLNVQQIVNGVYSDEIYENVNISECEKFIDYKIRESLKYPESASEFFAFKFNGRYLCLRLETAHKITVNETSIDADEFLISEKERFLEWLEYHGININL